ncbi:MAG: hypothetical protein U1A78_05535 [Polyangia bacterium]
MKAPSPPTAAHAAASAQAARRAGDGRGPRGGLVVVGWLLWLVCAGVLGAMWACLAPPLSLSLGPSDGATDKGGSTGRDGPPNLVGLFTIAGCSDLSFSDPDGEPRCLGTAPLNVQLVLLEVGSTMHRWSVTPLADVMPPDAGVPDGGIPDGGIPDGGIPDGGNRDGSLLDETQSHARAPSLTLNLPGTYAVSLAVAGPGGTATASGLIEVSAGTVGAPCKRDSHCASGLLCLCGSEQPGRDGTCPGGLGAGLCTKSCDGGSCPAGSVCIDLSRTQAALVPDGGSGDAFRRPICVPGCAAAKCRSDLVCRDLPVLATGGRAGDPLKWGRGCFAQTPGGVGAACLAPDGKPDATACATGLCEGLGLRGLCTAACGSGCPSEAACATWNSPLPPAPSGPRCLARCDSMRLCGDPLLDCLSDGGSGSLGFRLTGEPAGTTVCAPRRCTADPDCPGGRCVLLGGARFCQR